MTRFLLYSHDTYGLGHFRRSSLIAEGLVSCSPDDEALIVTGSPSAQAFPLPERVDTIKLPTVTKDERGSYRPRKLGGDLADLVELRSRLIRGAAAAYRPDVVVVDHAPLGMGGELVGMLDDLRRRADLPRVILGLRDVIDGAPRVEHRWSIDGVWERLALYDDIFVYGDRTVATTACELDLERRVPCSVTHTGYLAPTMPEPMVGEPFLLVTVGGGGDGQGVLRRYLDAVELGAADGVRSVVVTGPLLSAARRAELIARTAAMPSVELREFTPDLRSLISSAAGVISMAGYNTVVEVLSARTPAMLVPRTRPRMEQALRARRLAAVTEVDVTTVEGLTPDRVAAFAAWARHEPVLRHEIDLGGIDAVITALTADRERGAPVHA